MTKEKKPFIEAFVRAQYDVLSSKDNKERLAFTVAGIKDGHFYNHAGIDFGLFDDEVEDTEFISKEDLKLSRITGVKLSRIQAKLDKFFSEYYGLGNEQSAVADEDAAEDEKEVAEKKDKKAKKAENQELDDAVDEVVEKSTPEPEPTIDLEAVEKACKKAIKKGDYKLAKKLIEKIEHKDLAKKMNKKLKKAQG